MSNPHLRRSLLSGGSGDGSLGEIRGTVFNDVDVFFTATVTTGAVDIAGSLYGDSEVFFTAVVAGDADQAITGSLYAETDTFFTAVVAPGAADIAGSLYAETDTFLTATVAPGAVDIAGSLFADTDTFFASVTTTVFNTTGDLFTETDVFFTAVVSATYGITGSLFADAETFFTSALTTGAVDIAGALFADTDTFFDATVAQDGTQAITGSLFTDTDTFFTATVAPGAVNISGALFDDTDTFFGATVANAATFGHRQTKGADAGNVSSATLTYDTALLSGSLLVAAARRAGGSGVLTSIADGTNGTYAARIDQDDATTLRLFVSDFANNTSTGTPTVTFTWGGSSTTRIGIGEYSGVATSTPVDQSGVAVRASDTTPTTPALTTTVANTVLVNIWGINGNAASATPDTGQTERIELAPAGSLKLYWADRVVTATGTYDQTITLNAADLTTPSIIAYKKA